MKLILASASRDRKRMFELSHIPVEIIPSDFDEDSVMEMEPYRLVQRLALEKAKTVQKKIEQLQNYNDSIIIAADTMVNLEGDLIGKADSPDHAFKILSRLCGTWHELITGVAILSLKTGEAESFVDCSKVHFQNLTPEEIRDYIAVTDEYRGRAGAYSLQERASLFIDRIEGSPTNVLGLPMAELRMRLKKYGVNLLNPPPI
jgi:septum formation protein